MAENTAVQNFLRSELSFYGTIIVAVFTIAAMYFGMTNRIDLLAQKLDYANAENSEVRTSMAAVQIRITNLEKDVALLQSRLK